MEAAAATAARVAEPEINAVLEQFSALAASLHKRREALLKPPPEKTAATEKSDLKTE
jgi:hypothetical protein